MSTSALRPKVSITEEDARDIFRAFFEPLRFNSLLPLSERTWKAKWKFGRQAEGIYSKDIANNRRLAGMPVEEAVKAADASDTEVGLLAGTLVLQRSLDLMQYEYPILTSVLSDFSAEPGLLNQIEMSRIVLKPAVQTWNPATDAAGRPKGWDTVSPAQTADVPVKLDEYVGVPIVFGSQILAETMRRLFEETGPQALQALGGYFVRKLTNLLTTANYPAYAAATVGGGAGATTLGSNTIAVDSTVNMYPGQAISSPGNLPPVCYVQSIVDPTHANLTQKAIAANSGLTFAVGPGFDDGGNLLPIPNLYASYVSPVADFNMASLGQIQAAFDAGMVPYSDRKVLLNANYYQRLAQDPSFNTFFAAMRKPEVITEGELPRLMGFGPQRAPWFPSSSNRVGFAYHRSAAILKARLPSDVVKALGVAVPGSVTTVTAPSGLSVLLVQYVNLQTNYAEWRPEIMLGAAVGERRAGLVITSA